MEGFRIPTRIQLQPGCSRQLAETVAGLGASRLSFVTDRTLGELDVVQAAVDELSEAGITCDRFDEVEVNPRIETVDRLAERVSEFGSRVVVGFGGGSVIDAAKAAAMLAVNPGGAREYVGRDRFSEEPLPMIAVPTTCGTGSEVTSVAVLSDVECGTKVSIKGEGMFPTVALADADLLQDLPADLVATTGLDAMTHAIEATIGAASNPVSDILAGRAVYLLANYLPRAVAGIARDTVARVAVMRASTAAGLAFGNADVGAVHCLAETVGGIYDVPHGLANAVFLAPALRHHGSVVEPRLAALEAHASRKDMPRATVPDRAEQFIRRVEAMVSTLRLPSFASFGIPAEDYPRIAAGAVANGSNGSNPRSYGVADYTAILAELAASN